jgi:multidrug efflux pump subunit AcrB
MPSITTLAQRFQRIVFALVGGLMLFGIYSYFTLPAREDPEITIREAVVTTRYDGLTPRRIEQLVTKPLEEAIRGLPEVDEITSSSLPGLSIIHVEVDQAIPGAALDQIWDDLRDEVEDARGRLPEGAGVPVVTDDFGAVSVVTAALIGPGYAMGEMADMAVHVRDRLYAVDGVRTVELHGVVPERIEVRTDRARLAQLGLSPGAVARALRTQNVNRPGGEVDMGDRALLIEPTGDYDTVEAIGDTLIPTPAGGTIPLRDVAAVERTLVDPAPRVAYVNGERAVVLAVSMLDGQRVLEFGPRVRDALDEIEAGLPVGYRLETVTFQADQVEAAVYGVTINVAQTLALVCGVVILLLGLRTGLIVGAIVPSVMLATIAVMGFMGLPLERMSLATLVIALGLFVDNGIVVGEDFKRRLLDGVSRDEALDGVGRELALPLLASTATTVLVFLPLMLAQHTAGEYTRSISIVVAISLSISWVFAMALTPILCRRFLPTPDLSGGATAKRPYYERMFDPLKAGYRSVLAWVLAHRVLFLAGTVACLVAGVAGVATAPSKFFPDSDRPQVIAYLDLPAGVTADRTDAAVRDVLGSLEEAGFDWLDSHVAYVGYGGPRFVLSLTPVDQALNRAVMVLNVADRDRVGGAIDDLRALFRDRHPDVRATVARMFLGPSDSNVLEVRLSGPDPDYLDRTAPEIEAILATVPGAIDISTDWENRVQRLVVEVDQARARDAGVTSADVAEALQGTVSGAAISEFREGDDTIPIVARGAPEARTDPQALETLPVFGADGRSVPLGQVAEIVPVNGFSRIERADMTRAITIEARSTQMAAEGMAGVVADRLEAFDAAMPPGHALEIAGIVEESGEGRAALLANMPLCFAIIAVLLVAQFNSFRRALIVLGTLPLIVVGAALGLRVMGAEFGFMPILGILSLAGVILNNAIVLIDRIDIEREEGAPTAEAVLEASVRRLRPILMTTTTTVLGLLPIILTRDPLFYGLASVMAWGLVVGTVLTLGVVPVLYAALFRDAGDEAAEGGAADEGGPAPIPRDRALTVIGAEEPRPWRTAAE